MNMGETMTDIELKHIAAMVVKGMKDHHAIWIDPEIHAEQHEFIAILLEERKEELARRKEKLARRKAMEDKVAGSLMITLIIAIVTFIGNMTLEYFRNHVK